MICERCKKEIDDNSNFCPYCGQETKKEVEELELPSCNRLGVAVLVISILSTILSIFPLSKTIILVGLFFGAIGLGVAIFQNVKEKHKLSILTIVIASVGFVSNCCWLLFIEFML
ncbi:MAG: zinc-ribbon domain-containing protein [Bacilli bacterium]|nr:zinc-ribbon domain-containing protein [Bacilli bacterium]